MSIPRSVAEVLKDHVTLELESLDRLYLNVYVPKLQHELGVVSFFRFHRGHAFASSALMDPISKAFIAQIDRFVAARGVPLIAFGKGQRKDDLARAHLARFAGDEGLLFVGKAQEKTRSSGPRSAGTRRPAAATPGSSAPPRWSTTTTSTASTGTSARSS
jgi:hypothetical protein